MNGILKTAITVLTVSILALIWGFQYRGSHQMQAVASLLGSTDPTFALAGWAIGLGILAFLIGLVLLIVGLVRPSRTAD